MIYSLIYILPLSIISAYTLIPGIMNDRQPSNPLWSLLVILPMVILLCELKNVDSKRRIIILSSVVSLLIGVILVTKRETRAEWFSENSWIGYALCVSVAVFGIGEMIKRSHKLKLITGIIMLGVLISSLWLKIINNKFCFAAAMFLILTIIMEEVRHQDRQDGLLRKFVVRIIPFLVLEGFLLVLIPIRNVPYDWAITKKAINKISDGITILIQSIEDIDSAGNLDSSVGFSENSKMSGNVGEKPKEVMKLDAGIYSPSVVYLDGKYFEDFDGKSWSEAEKSYPYMMDTIETCCATAMLQGDIYRDYCKNEEIKITYTGQNTRYVFAPVKTLVSDAHFKDTEVSYSENEILFDEKKGNTTSYRIKYIYLNRNNETFPVLCENGEKITKEIWDNECLRHGLEGKEEYSFENFLAYRENLYNDTLNPNALSRDDLSPDVCAFLDEALDGAQTDYEKLCALERAFSDFEYTTNPGALPKEVDSPTAFLDYFLLESKRGYCNSFATAFSLLCRAEGIPVRMVHGYCVTECQKGIKSIQSTMAHAYPEAYLKGAGWLVFDPTPGYAVNNTWDKMGEYAVSNYTYNPSNYSGLTVNEDGGEEETVEGNAEVKWYMIVIPITLCVLVLVVIVLIQRLLNIRHFKKLETDEKGKIVSYRILTLLRRQGIVKADYETIREYAGRVRSERGIVLNGFVNSMETILYSAKGISEENLAELDGEYSLVRDELKGIDKVIYVILNFIGLL